MEKTSNDRITLLQESPIFARKVEPLEKQEAIEALQIHTGSHPLFQYTHFYHMFMKALCTIPIPLPSNQLVPVFSDQTLQFSINLFICFHAGQPIASKVVIVAPSSLVKVQFYNFTFILLIRFHSVSKFLKGAQNRSEYFKMVTYMYM